MISARQIRTQGLTEGAILAALVAVLAIATHYVPPIGLATTFLCPLPLAVLVIRHGFKVAAVATIVSVLVASVIAGPIVGVVILVSFAPMGLVLGIGGRRGWSAVRTVGVASVASALSTLASFLGLLGGGRLSLSEMARTMEQSVAMTTDFYSRLGIPESQLESAVKPMQEYARLLPYLLPMMVVLGGATMAWVNYEVGRRVLARLKYVLPILPPLRTWRLPAAAVWLVPVSSFALAALALPVWVPVADILRERLGTPPLLLQSVGVSLAVTVLSLFMVQGLVAAWVILGNYGFGKLAQVMAVVIAMTQPALGIVALMLGVLDSALKVRERWGLRSPAPARAGP